jgi:hypothetical protein
MRAPPLLSPSEKVAGETGRMRAPHRRLVIPAQAGIQGRFKDWMPAFAGMTVKAT